MAIIMSDEFGTTKQNVAILGATGTIGLQTLDVISRYPERFQVFALSANHNVSGMLKLCIQFQPKFAVMLQTSAAETLSKNLKELGCRTVVLSGEKALSEIVSHEDVHIVMAAIVGAAGLLPAMAAARTGKRILLANKETLVLAGNLFMQAVIDGGAELLPIDSEHNAIFQVMPHQRTNNLKTMGIRRILLTASGGPFRDLDLQQMKSVTKVQALNHPNWVMGPKITIDSATMMNKGLKSLRHTGCSMPAQIRLMWLCIRRVLFIPWLNMTMAVC